MTSKSAIAAKCATSAPSATKRPRTSPKSPKSEVNPQRKNSETTLCNSTASETEAQLGTGANESMKAPGGKRSRRKGAVGQSISANLLRYRDWVIDQITVGVSAGDLIGTDPVGGKWCIEVKNCAGILPSHLTQAREQAKRRGLPWMLMSKIAGTSCWLVRRQGQKPVIWEEKA